MTAQLESLIKTGFIPYFQAVCTKENVWIIMVQYYPQRVLTWADDFRELTELKRTVVSSARATVRDSSEFLRRKHDGVASFLF